MPGFGGALEGGAINDLAGFLITGHDVAETAGNNPNFLKYRNDGYNIFLDQEGYPAISPPWKSGCSKPAPTLQIAGPPNRLCNCNDCTPRLPVRLIFGNSLSMYLRSFADFTSLCSVATVASWR